MDEQLERSLREEAVRRHDAGESVSSIAANMQRSREWLHLWLRRRREAEGRAGWSHSHSHARRSQAGRIAPELEQLIAETRLRLSQERFADIGPDSILDELAEAGVEPLPGRATVARALKRLGLVVDPEKRGRRPKSGLVYPEPRADAERRVQEADFVGPRYVASNRLFLLNAIDRHSGRTALELLGDRSEPTVRQGLGAIFARLGNPERLKLDNDSTFCGLLGPSGLCRFLLWHGTTPFFIPIREPWRNGKIESFNGRVKKKLFDVERFAAVADLEARVAQLERYRNRRLKPYLDGFSPLPAERYDAWPEGSVLEFARFIRSNRQLKLFDRSYTLAPEQAHSYVIARLEISRRPQEGNLLVFDALGTQIELLQTTASWHRRNSRHPISLLESPFSERPVSPMW